MTKMNNNKCLINNNYIDPEKLDLEIVERKGLGHPDTLADGVANYVSIKYSEFCLANFGVVLHHNLDKVYVGGGIIEKSFEGQKTVKPINVVLNGRISDEFSGEKIDITNLITKWTKEYLSYILPNINTNKDIKILVNCNQAAEKGSVWYRPRNIGDLPEYERLYANDTSVCVAHSPMTVAENITYSLEQYFWDRTSRAPKFKYADYGQDIKVMTVREEDNFEVTLCVPVLMGKINNWDEYEEKVKDIEDKLRIFAKQNFPQTKVSIYVNKGREGYRKYTLPKGTCAEVGEEGIVGRGNNSRGIISIFRPHTMEAPFGKNPKYHTGKVLGFLAQKLSDEIYKNTGAKNTVVFLTKNEQDLLPPFLTELSVSQDVDKKQIEEIFNSVMKADYLKEILKIKYIN